MRWWLALAIIFAVALSLWRPIKKPPTEVVSAAATTTTAAPVLPPTVPFEPPTPATAAPTENNFFKVLYDCVPSAPSVASPTELLLGLQKNSSAPPEVAMENWHIRLQGNTEERVMLVTSDRENAGGKKEVRWFGVDREGLPVPRKLDPAKAFDPSPAFLDTLLSRGDVVYHDVHEAVKFRDGGSASVFLVNNQVSELQYFRPGQRTLSCHSLNCQCK